MLRSFYVDGQKAIACYTKIPIGNVARMTHIQMKVSRNRFKVYGLMVYRTEYAMTKLNSREFSILYTWCRKRYAKIDYSQSAYDHGIQDQGIKGM